MSLGSWLLFFSQQGTPPPPSVPPIGGVTMALYVSGCAFTGEFAGPSFAGFFAAGPAPTAPLVSPSYAAELTRDRA